MNTIAWSTDLEIGIPPIDKQHKRIVDYINELEKLKDSNTTKEVGDVLEQLVDYTLSHFAFEEELMEESDYVFVKAHKRVHQLFVRKIASYVERFKTGENITNELLRTLRTWLVNHIKTDDNDYSLVVRRKMNIVTQKKGWLNNVINKIFGKKEVIS